jgi:hypothetical protein
MHVGLYFNQSIFGNPIHSATAYMHRHLVEAIPLHVHCKFMQFRLNCTDLRIHDHVITRERFQRLCTLCGEQIEDEQLIVFECRFYNTSRDKYSLLFRISAPGYMNKLNECYSYAGLVNESG